MRNSIKVIFSLTLLIFFLVACFGLISIGYVGLWLHTYQTFTYKAPVAEVIISEKKHDSLGDYTDVDLTLIQKESALLDVVNQKTETQADKKETQHYKLYGDSVYIGGPIVKFKDHLILLNFRTIFKVAKIFGRYNLDNSLEKNRTPNTASTFDITSGYSEWKDIEDVLSSNTLLSKAYNLFIDTAEGSSTDKFVSNKPVKYNLYITNNGFEFDNGIPLNQ